MLAHLSSGGRKGSSSLALLVVWLAFCDPRSDDVAESATEEERIVSSIFRDFGSHPQLPISRHLGATRFALIFWNYPYNQGTLFVSGLTVL